MSYQSGLFLFFAAGVTAGYYICGAINKKLQKYLLLAANFVFIAYNGPKYLPFLAVTMLASFFAAKYIAKCYRGEKELLAGCTDKEEKKTIRANAKAKAKRGLVAALVITIGLLAVCKYTNFVIDTLNAVLTKLHVKELSTFSLILPLGISFYTFMAVGYVLDVYWKRYEAEEKFVPYAVFLSYFPHLVQGPIDRYGAMREAINNGASFDWDNIIKGAELVLWGLFKKLVVADRIGIFVDTVYGNIGKYKGLIFLAATITYAIQLYADFSGCIDIVSGVSEMMGIPLTRNFNHPYFSETIAEFWRRWHISLMEWFRDYVYMPLSGSGLVRSVKKHFKDKGKARAERLSAVIIPTLVIWTLTGLWHGASWKFVAWGAYYAIIMVVSAITEEWVTKVPEKLHIRTDVFSWRFFRMARTFVITTLGRVIFRAGRLTDAFKIYKSMFSGVGITHFLGDNFYSYGLTAYDIILSVFCVFIMWAVDMLQERLWKENRRLRDVFAEQNLVFRWVILLTAILAVVIFGMYGPQYNAAAFIYEQF